MSKLPSQVLDLKNWYLTLPIGEVEKPLNVYQPELDKYSHSTHFFVPSSESSWVVFRAHAGGVTTKNSLNPRSELREMTNNGKDKASWKTTSGIHIMTFKGKTLALPETRPSVVIGQIHDGSDDVIEVRCWIPKGKTSPVIDVFHDSTVYGLLTDNYKLGDEYTIRILAEKGVMNVFYNDMNTPKLKIKGKKSGCYFKAGCYIQANPTKHGAKPEEFAEAWLSQVIVEHRVSRGLDLEDVVEDEDSV